MKLSDIFEIVYPKTLVYAEMTPDDTGINFVSSQEKNNGVVGRVEPVDEAVLYPAGIITVPLKGSVLMAHLQAQSCYVAHQIAVLKERQPMSEAEKLFYVTCIRFNSFKYSYGRQADKTLGDLQMLDIPTWVESSINHITTKNTEKNESIDIKTWGVFQLGELFEIKKGKRLTADDQTEGDTPYIGAIASNNGVANHIGQNAIHKGNTISLSYNGSVGEAFYQPNPFWATDDVNVLYFRNTNKVAFNKYIALFICAVLRLEKFKFSYGRKWTLENMCDTKIKLPEKNGKPDWLYMESYIKSLPYGDRI